MAVAYYFDCKPGHNGSLSRVGGQPTHLPINKPWPDAEDYLYAFILQLEVDGTRIDLPDVAFLQFYQLADEGSDPTPCIVPVPGSAPVNTQRKVVESPFVDQLDIAFIRKEDPDEMPDDLSLGTASLFKSKIGGVDPWVQLEDAEFLLQVTEDTGSNFGGTACVVYRDLENRLLVSMA